MRRPVLLLLCAALVLATGCASIQSLHIPYMSRPSGMRGRMTLEGLSQELAFQATSFAAWVSTAADDIQDKTDSRRIRRNALLWRLRMIPIAQRAAFAEDPRAGYIRSLQITVLQRRYFETGDGRDLFGPQQPIALDVAKRLEQQAVEIGERFLKKSELERVVAEVNSNAEKYPIQGREFSLQRAISGTLELQESDLITSVLSIPLAPFRALQGVDSGAQAIREFNVTARRFTDVAASLPEQIRGQLELFMYDFEDRETVEKGLAAFQSLSASADRASHTVAELPEDLRETLRVSLEDSKSTVAKLTDAVDKLRELMGPLDDTAKNLREGSVAWREALGSWEQRNSDPHPGRPFDIREWGDTANSIGNAALELRGLASDAGGLQASDALTAAIDRSIDRIFWRAALLIALFFGGLIVYRVIASRLARRT
ncbi:MAG TPA: hypothetical protein VMS55_06910 [Myxococcota bacterium]|nr:hypothetical protein [Myxococcota bacterium]